jgi:hypothetical protein
MVVALVVIRDGHISRFGYPGAAGNRVVLDFVTGANGVACDGIAASVTGGHGLNHL